jgi:hypothetical protein
MVWFRALYYWARKWDNVLTPMQRGLITGQDCVAFCETLALCALHPPPSPSPVDTALINAHLIYKELHPEKSGISTMQFRADVVDALISTAGVHLPASIPLRGVKHLVAPESFVQGAKTRLVVIAHQHAPTVEEESNKRGDCAVCGRKTKFKCADCDGPQHKGLWFCISAARNCWAAVHKK